MSRIRVFPNLIIRIMAVGLLLCLVLPVQAQSPSDSLADTPWPMFQHDRQHTGRSPFLMPLHQPELLFTHQLPGQATVQISIAQNGDMIIPTGFSVQSIDPVSRTVRWTYPFGGSSITIPLHAADGSIYWSYFNNFVKILANGLSGWRIRFFEDLPILIQINSSAVFDLEGNLYLSYEGLWSLTPQGELRWYLPGDGSANTVSPAVGYDGSIITELDKKLCAVKPDSTRLWCIDPPGTSRGNTVAIGADGTIYYPSEDVFRNPQSGVLSAIDPMTGSVRWRFDTDEPPLHGMRNGIAIAPNGDIYFPFTAQGDKTFIYSVNPAGSINWKLPLPTNPITKRRADIDRLTTDREGNILLCAGNSSCYGIAANGTILWEYALPLEDSILNTPSTQAVIAADGLIYFIDLFYRVHVLADPHIYPVLRTPVKQLAFDLDEGNASFSHLIPVESSSAPLSYQVSVDPAVDWLSLNSAEGVTPAQIEATFHTNTLSAGIYQTTLTIRPADKPGLWLEIPVRLNVGLKQIAIPAVHRLDTGRAYQLLYHSNWFFEDQLVRMDYPNLKRTVLNHSLPYQIVQLKYSPDGQKIALQIYAETRMKIVVLDVQTGASLLEIKDAHNPVWSPQSDEIAFIAAAPNTRFEEIHRIRIDGSRLTRLTYDSVPISDMIWSPTGDKFAINVSHCATYLMNSDGSNLRQITMGSDLIIPQEWSPDGRYLLVKRHTQDIYNPEQLWVYDTQTGDSRLLTWKYLFDARWSPDGSLIAYVSKEDDAYANWGVFLIQPDGYGIRLLTPMTLGEDRYPVWSPDSQWIAFTSKSRNLYNGIDEDIYVIHRDGSGVRKITTNIQTDTLPFWVP